MRIIEKFDKAKVLCDKANVKFDKVNMTFMIRQMCNRQTKFYHKNIDFKKLFNN